MKKQNLRHLSFTDLQDLLITMGEPKFRAKQIWEWIWKKGAHSIDDMTNLSLELRQKLNENYAFNKVKVHHTQHSEDGTIKNRLELYDGPYVESVLIPAAKRLTVCVSSQVGCSLACKFCATGFLPRLRNMDYDEIVDQVTLINEQATAAYGKPVSNVVFMGMGEPLLNYKNVMKAIERLTATDGLSMSPRRITVSTAGVAKMIRQLGDDGVKLNLALSLHAATDEKRGQIMPINDTNNLKELLASLNYFYEKTGNEITFEYILFKNFNDSISDAEDLIRVYRQVPVHMVNLIEYNPIEKASFEKPDDDVVDRFMAHLSSKKVNVHLRRSRGKDIDAACGQLANVG